MGLVDYSDSESDSEQQPQQPRKAASPKPPAKPPTGLSALLPKPKRRTQKPDEPSDGPKKIVVNLPKFDDKDDAAEQPAAKKQRIGGGGSGLGALLPAPKKRKEKEAQEKPKERVLGGALAPPRPEVLMSGEGDEEERTAEGPKQPTVEDEEETPAPAPASAPAPPAAAPAKPATQFVPQSVARKTIQPMSAFRKKGAAPKAGTAQKASAAQAQPKKEPVKPKVSLFGNAGAAVAAPKPVVRSSAPTGEYKPIMLEAPKPAPRPAEVADAVEGMPSGSGAIAYGGEQQAQEVNDLHTLAQNVGLDENTLRHMYGRHGPGEEPIQIANFSVDQEYQQNELARQLGLAEEVKTVRAIQPGKHQLRTLLSSAQQQKGALEESFARGKSSRKEAGSKYGW